MMQGDPVTMDYQQFQEGLPEDTPHIKQPVACDVSGDGQVGLVDPFEPELVEKHRNDELNQGKDFSVLGSPDQTPCPLYESIVDTSNIQPQTPPPRTVGTWSRKPCHCTRSQCLKLYCECFASGAMCINCDCSNCHNNSEHQIKRHKAIKSCLGRNPDAFRPKIAGGKSGVVRGRHNKGCNCKRSGCLKNYCECYEANIMCTSSCKCVGCRNYDEGSQMSLKWKTASVGDKRPEFTSSVVEAVCGCLLTQAEREAQSLTQAEHRVLEEFGHCLSQIVKTAFK
ncbi:spexin prohormone 2 [Mugil cephalus]|uniref:spexin prohormone 2 n=1 Tax=Mugil cephalus TaxID=48193 RepID=UPI001FB6FDE9|nr:spexin prohormone 2 [Mugil cephalus]